VRILALVSVFLSLCIGSAWGPGSALALQAVIPPALSWPADLPVYDHVVIVIEENKNYEQIIGNKNDPYINDV